MADFDPDAWMAKQGKGAVKVASTFDPDAWMAKQKQPAKTARVMPALKSGPLAEARQEHARRQQEMTPGTGGNIAIGGERGYRKSIESSLYSLGEVTEGMKRGDFGPLGRMVKEAAIGTYESLKPPSPQFKRDQQTGTMAMTGLRPDNPALVAAQREREARYLASPEGQRSAARLAELDQRAALDPSWTGKAVRGVSEFATGAAPTLATAIATRGAILPTAIAAGLQSANNPGQMLPQAAAGMLPAPSVAPLVRRLRGRPRPTTSPTLARTTQPERQMIDTQPMPAIQGPARPTAEMPRVNNYTVEDAPTVGLQPRLPVRERISEMPDLYAVEAEPFGVRANLSLPRSYPGARGPRMQETQFEVLFAQARGAQPPIKPPIDAELGELWKREPQQQALFKGAPAGVSETPSLGKAIGATLRTASQGMRTLWTSFDLSAPMAQGAILSIAHPIKAARSFGKMFRSLNATQSAAIDQQILNHPLRKQAEEAGLYLATAGKRSGAPDEFFAIEALNKLPGIRHSERAYRTYLDTLRLSTWESYVKSLQASGASPKAYRQAAEFINIATGRGALKEGGKLAKAMDLGGDLLFAPRNLVSNFQLLDPVRYAALAPGARKVVLRDALTAFGAMLSTAALLKAAGAVVSFDPESDGFMSARFGNTRYDLTAGRRTQVQFLARMLAGTYREVEGEGNLPGKDPLSTASRYARGKLAPLYSTAATFAVGRDFKGESVADKSALKTTWEAAAPLLWRELLESYQQEGALGVAKTSPAFFGQRVSTYPDRAKPEWLETPEGFRQAGEKRMFLEPRRAEDKTEKDETPEAFSARKANVEGLLSRYGRRLIESKAYKGATSEEKKAAREYLRRAIRREDVNVGLLDPLAILSSVRESAFQKKQRAAR